MLSNQCVSCEHYRGALQCDAFRRRIPQEILSGEFDHSRRWPGGDRGVRFKPLEMTAAVVAAGQERWPSGKRDGVESPTDGGKYRPKKGAKDGGGSGEEEIKPAEWDEFARTGRVQAALEGTLKPGDTDATGRELDAADVERLRDLGERIERAAARGSVTNDEEPRAPRFFKAPDDWYTPNGSLYRGMTVTDDGEAQAMFQPGESWTTRPLTSSVTGIETARGYALQYGRDMDERTGVPVVMRLAPRADGTHAGIHPVLSQWGQSAEVVMPEGQAYVVDAIQQGGEGVWYVDLIHSDAETIAAAGQERWPSGDRDGVESPTDGGKYRPKDGAKDGGGGSGDEQTLETLGVKPNPEFAKREWDRQVDTDAFYLAQERGIPHDQYVTELRSHLTEITAPGQTQVAIRVPSDVVEELLDDGRFQSQHETGQSSGMLDTSLRSMAEEMMFSYPEDGPAAGRPIYGYLTASDPGYKGFPVVEQYGDTTWVLKDDIRPRVTFSAIDSLGLETVPAPINAPEVTAAGLGNYRRQMLGREPAGDPLDVSPQKQDWPSQYWEAQIHGGVTLDDIDHVVLPSVGWGVDMDVIKQRLDQAGIRWEQTEEES